MNKKLDLLFKIFTFPWFGFLGFMIFAITYDMLTGSEDTLEAKLFLAAFSVSAIVAFRITFKTWKLYGKREPSELLLDDLEPEDSRDKAIYFIDYKLSSFLAILVGGTSVAFGIWALSMISGISLLNIEDILRILLVITLISFGLLLIHRAVYLWIKTSVSQKLEE